ARRPPHVLPNFMGLEILSSIEKIYSSFKGVVHGNGMQVVEKQREIKNNRASETGHNTHVRGSVQALFLQVPLPILSACKGVTPGYSTVMGWSKLRSLGFWNTHSSQDNF